MTSPGSPESRWNAEIQRRLGEGNDLEFTVDQFAQAVGTDEDNNGLKAFLDQKVASGAAAKIDTIQCPVATCQRSLPPAGGPYAICPYCHTDYQEEGEEVERGFSYRLKGGNSRDIRWMIVVHGMNSRAIWQEEFSWQIANRLHYSAPVLIYKYGWATIDVLVRPLHRRLAKRLGERIRVAIAHAAQSGRPTAPDIIAHSFGTLLLSLILEDKAFDDLKFGRVITAGSIIRPDFDWDPHLASGRFEAVFNHVAAKDSAVPAAQFAIPGAGPGGTKGYASNVVINVRNEEFGHSSFFEQENLRVLIADGGPWHSFLTHPLAQFRPLGAFSPQKVWQPASPLLLAPARILGYALFCAAAPFSWLRRRIDP